MPNPSSSPEVHCPLAIGGAVRSVHGHAEPAEEHRLQQPPEPEGVQRRVQQAPDDVVVAHVVPVVGAVGGRRVQQAQPLRPPHGPRVSVLPCMGPGVRQVGQPAPEEGRGAEVSVGPERPPQGKDGGPGLPQTLIGGGHHGRRKGERRMEFMRGKNVIRLLLSCIIYYL